SEVAITTETSGSRTESSGGADSRGADGAPFALMGLFRSSDIAPAKSTSGRRSRSPRAHVPPRDATRCDNGKMPSPRPSTDAATTPGARTVDFGDLGTLEPVSRHWGFDRGRPVDRYYIEAFLEQHAADVRGRVLEVGDDSYTRRFGKDRVIRRDVLHVSADAPGATIVADLADAPHVASESFDCIILTQTLHLVYHVPAALRTLARILRPGGVLLLTVPGITPTTDDDWRSSWYWSFTAASLRRA